MGTVWMARGRGTREAERFFVVKTLRDEHSGDPEFREMLFDEARIASGIDHPNVARIFDFGDEAGIPYLVMEVVDGESLQRIYRDARKRRELLPPAIALRIVADACGGLHAAHELRDLNGRLRDVVHRDISPHNVLVGMNGVTKLIDFGVAKARDRVAGKTATGQVKGKLRYLAPEQVHDEPIDRRVDIWGLGSVLYLLLVGRPAYDGAHDAAILTALLYESHGPIPDAIPAPVRAVIEKAIARDPAERFATADEMRVAIERAAKKTGLVAKAEDVAKLMNAHYRADADARHDDLASAVEVTTQRPRPRPASEVFYVESTEAMPTRANEIAKKPERVVRSRKSAKSSSMLETLKAPNDDTKRGIYMGVGITVVAMTIAFVVAFLVVAHIRAH